MSAEPGPLAGVRVVEFEGLGPGPLAGMLLADWGADVVVVGHRTEFGGRIPARFQIANRGKRLTAADLKVESERAAVLELLDRADVLIEGFRPGTMERLGIGPNAVHARNPRLVYTRITGWGQSGPRAPTAGHDIAYIATTGALAMIGRAGEAPVPPVNLLGDFAGGTMFAVAGTLAALHAAQQSGLGQVVDAAMVDGVLALMTPLMGMHAAGQWSVNRGTNLLDTGAPFYDVYRTLDGRFVAVGALEDRFFAALLRGLGIDPATVADRWDSEGWPSLRARFADEFGQRTRDEWVKIFEGSDACVAPVLDLEEAASDAGNQARGMHPLVDGVRHPAPAPRFGRTPSRAPTTPAGDLVPLASILKGWSP